MTTLLKAAGASVAMVAVLGLSGCYSTSDENAEACANLSAENEAAQADDSFDPGAAWDRGERASDLGCPPL